MSSGSGTPAPAGLIPAELAHPDLASPALAPPELAAADVELLRGVLLGRAGLQLGAAQERRAGRLLDALVRESGLSSAHALLLAARLDPALAERVAARFTVGETYFMRGGSQLDALRGRVLPELAARAGAPGRLTLWSAGCSSGEEAYTLALLAEEVLPARAGWQVEVLGSDLSGAALDRARAGHYGAWSFRGLAEAERDHLLTRLPQTEARTAGDRAAGDGGAGEPLWTVRPATRARVRFRQHNLLDPAPVQAQLILCRNVTIYLERRAVQRVYARLAAALAPGGLLMLAPTDPQPDSALGLGLYPQRLRPGGFSTAATSALWGRAPQGEDTAVAVPGRPPAPGSRPPPMPAAPLPREVNPAGMVLAAPVPTETMAAGTGPALKPPLLMAAEAAPDDLTQARQLTYLHPGDPLAQLALAQALERAGAPARARSGVAHCLALLGAVPQGTVFPGGLSRAQVQAHALALSARLEQQRTRPSLVPDHPPLQEQP